MKKSSFSPLSWMYFILLNFVSYSNTQFPTRLNCPPVPDRISQNVVVKCKNAFGSDANCSSALAPGSIVKFSCPKYFVPKNGTQFIRQNKEINCSLNGKWSDFQNFMKFVCVPECGKYYIQVDSSSEIDERPPPWQVTILKNRRRESCDGSLIPSLIGNTSVILTSRDCISSSNGTQLSNKDLKVSLIRENFGREFVVKSIFVPLDPKSNIAILNVSFPVPLADNILPICLPFGQFSEGSEQGLQRLKPGRVGVILGTGTIKTELSLLSSEKCLEGFGYSPSDTEFCTIKVAEGSPVSCPSVDGPFLLPEESNSNYSNETPYFRAYGVQSGNLRVNSCQLGIIFTKISSFQNWISQVLREIAGVKEVPKPILSCESRNCGVHSYCKRDERQEFHCVCEEGWTRDVKNGHAGCKRILGTEKPNSITSTQSPRDRSSTTSSFFRPISEVTTCPSLLFDERDGFKIVCDYKNRGVDCLQKRVSIGTTAVYSCKKYYTPPNVGSSITTRVCQHNGSWTPLRRGFGCTLTCGEDGSQFQPIVDIDIVRRGPVVDHGGVKHRMLAGMWPWIVALYLEDPPGTDRFKFVCGGTLVSQNAVVTATQCVTQRTSTRPRNATAMKIVMGKYYRDFERRHTFAQERMVKEIHVHGDYRPFSLDNDIAVLFMDKPAKISEGVRPICLPTIKDEIPEVGDLGIMAGWGKQEDGRFPNEIQEIRIPLVSNETCRIADELLMDIVRPPKNFCAGYQNESLPAACDEDEGSGLFFQGSDRPRTWKLLGIASAILKNSEGHCRRDMFSVFTNVTAFRPWLDTVLDKDFNRT